MNTPVAHLAIPIVFFNTSSFPVQRISPSRYFTNTFSSTLPKVSELQWNGCVEAEKKVETECGKEKERPIGRTFFLRET